MFFRTNSMHRAFIISLGMNNNEEPDSLCLRVWLSKNTINSQLVPYKTLHAI